MEQRDGDERQMIMMKTWSAQPRAHPDGQGEEGNLGAGGHRQDAWTTRHD